MSHHPARPAAADGGPVEAAVDALREQAREVKPRLRGWLHAGAVPVAAVAAIVLVCLSPTLTTRLGSAVFGATAVLVFAVSAVYHRGSWSPRVWAWLRRFDHANIFLLIAGSYTPFTLLFLRGSDRVLLLSVVWSAAAVGVLFRLFWTDAPRWLYVPLYLGLGWVAVGFAGQFAAGAERYAAPGIAALVLIIVGGALYTAGAVVYGFKRPNPSPRWFGFHEVFHTCTIAAFVCHYVGVSLATYAMR